MQGRFYLAKPDLGGTFTRVGRGALNQAWRHGGGDDECAGGAQKFPS